MRMEKGTIERVKAYASKEIYLWELEEYANSDEYRQKKPKDFYNWTDEEMDNWHKFDEQRKAKWKYLYDRWKNAEEIKDFELGVPLDVMFGNVPYFLKRYNINTATTFYEETDGLYDVDDIVASDKFNLYKTEESASNMMINTNVNSHYIYVTDVTDDGKVIVSSWGNKYIFDDSNAEWSSKILIKSLNKGNI